MENEKERSLTPSKRYIRKINDLYIQTRKKYLVQFPEGKYITLRIPWHGHTKKMFMPLIPDRLL